MASRIRPLIGTAGWQIPAEHAGLFGPDESVLARYATRFDVVEINSSFHHAHQVSTYAKWAAGVPARFRFSAKLPKTITHDQRLQQSTKLLDRFIDEVSGLGNKLACLLVQLPPSLVYDARVANNFFGLLRRRTSVAITCEPRHPSWFEDHALWQRHGVSRVGADPFLSEAARVPGGLPGWPYWRWHGSPRMYYSSYGDVALQQLAKDVAVLSPARTQPWIIFDNTAHGQAAGDAARLQSLL